MTQNSLPSEIGNHDVVGGVVVRPRYDMRRAERSSRSHSPASIRHYDEMERGSALSDRDGLAHRFEADRAHLTSVAYRMLGSAAEADDAVQEAWLRVSRADTTEIDNLRGWLTTVVARICLDMLRSRRSRREDPIDDGLPDVAEVEHGGPEDEALMADSVGLRS